MPLRARRTPRTPTRRPPPTKPKREPIIRDRIKPPPTPTVTQPAVPVPLGQHQETLGPLPEGAEFLEDQSLMDMFMGWRAGNIEKSGQAVLGIFESMFPSSPTMLGPQPARTTGFGPMQGWYDRTANQANLQRARAFDYTGPSLTELLASPTFQYITQGPHMPKYSDYAGGGGAGGGGGGGYYQPPRGRSYGTGGGGISQARGLGLINWRIGL